MAATDLENTSWQLTAYFDGTALQRSPADAEVTLTFADGAAGGKSGCNRYRSAATIGDATLTFGPAMGTKMACPPPVMEVEQAYLRALEAVTTWRIADGALELRDSGGRPSSHSPALNSHLIECRRLGEALPYAPPVRSVLARRCPSVLHCHGGRR